MIFSATYQLNSKSCPGVVVTLRRMGRKRRASVEIEIAGARAKCQDKTPAIAALNAKIQALMDAVPGYRDAVAALPHNDDGMLSGEIPAELLASLPAEVWELAKQRTALSGEISNIENAEIYPAFIAAAVESIKGFEGKYTAEMLCESGPDALFDEIVEAINQNAYQTNGQMENLSLPTTSGVQGDGNSKSTNAPDASSDTASTSASAA